jgi:hypothetical protein
MRVSSPVGDFPFAVETVRLRRGRLLLGGRMGSWPTEVEVEPRDLLELLPHIRWSLAGGAALALIVFGRRAVCGRRERGA